MPDAKISALTAITTLTPATDVLPVVDVTGTTKKITTNQILGSGGTATLASATITGDLTVRTNKLFANATGVGVGTTSVFGDFNVQNSTNARCEIASSATGISYQVYDNARTGFLQSSIYASQHLWFNGVTEAMRLNSTGLGVGTSPSYKLDVNGVINTSSDIYALGGRFALYRSAGSSYIDWSSGQSLIFRTVTSAGGAGASTIATIDSSGNLGIGVTPSAKLDVAVTGAGTPRVRFTSDSDNPIVEWQRFQGTATNYYGYRIQGGFGALAFLNSNVAAIGSQTWTQAMTLDASGNLLVGKTAQNPTVIGFEVQSNGTVNSTLASAINANATFAAYSTGASAYRFYVGMGGTVFATNTTISAISDARLKENVQDIDVGLGAILALKPRKFDWKEGKGKNIKGDRGFIAQEFEQVFPQLVDEWKDEAPDGEAPYKSVRQDLIPVLVKAIQELTARVQTLETR